MLLRRWQFLLAFLVLAFGAGLAGDGLRPDALADPGAVTVREPAYGLPHIFADTDAELARENGRQIARDRLGQIVLISRVARGTLYQAFGALSPSTVNGDIATRQSGYTSSELNNMYDKLPADVKTLLLEYCNGVNDVIDEIYAGTSPEPLEVNLLRNLLGLGNNLFGNATNISDQVDPNYIAPNPPTDPGGNQFTPELAISIAVLQVRNFGSASINEATLLDQLNSLITKFGTDGDEIWDDLNFKNDPLAPVSVPDATTPGFGGPLAMNQPSEADLLKLASQYPSYDYEAALAPYKQALADREANARRLGAWPALGSYAWMIDGDRSATGNPWIGGFPQTGIQIPSIMHFAENRSAEGADHQIEGIGMEFVGAPLILIGQTDSVAFTTTTAALKNSDLYLEELVLEDTDALRYSDEGTPAAMNMRTEQIQGISPQTILVWRTHERLGNGGTRTVEAFQGNASGTAESGTSTTLTDNAPNAAPFGVSYAGGYVAITAGTGAGQMRAITSNTADTLTLTNPWTTTPDATSRYVAVQAGNNIIAVARERSFWLEESTAALGFSFFQRAESVLDIRRGVRMIPSTHNFLAADNQAFNGIGTNLGSGVGNTGYYSSGFSRKRQGGTPTDVRLPLDGTVANEYTVVSGSVGSAGANTLTSTGAFTGETFTPLAYNYRMDNPTQQGSEYIVVITGGNGYRQSRRIASNTDDTLTLEEDWGVTPSAGDTFEVYEIVGMPEAINPPNGYTANWNNKAATADDGPFGRQHRNIFIAERLAADSSWTRDEQRQLNEDVAGLDGKGKIGRYLIPRLRTAVDGVGNGGNPAVDTVLAQLEAHNGSPTFGRNYIDPVTALNHEAEVGFLNNLIPTMFTAIYGDEISGTSVPSGGFGTTTNLYLIQHAIDSAAGGPAGSYSQKYTGDFFNGTDWRVVVRDAFSSFITSQGGGIPADGPRSNSNYSHPLSLLHSNLVFDPTPAGNRGIWEQLVEVGPTVRGEMIFPLGQSGFIDSTGLPDRNAESLHHQWRFWRFVPMLHVAEDLASDPDGDVDNDGVLDGFEKYYFGSTSPAPTDDADGDGLTLLQEYQLGLDPTSADTDANGIPDNADDIDKDGCSNGEEVGLNQNFGGLRDGLSIWDVFDTPNATRTTLSAQVEDEALPPFNITVANAAVFPAAPNTLYINNEKFTYDSKTMTTFHITGRAIDPTVVGTHAINSAVVSNARDQAVSVGDISALVSRFGSSGNRNTRPLTPPPAPPAYHPAFDRLPAPFGMDPWDLRQGDGATTVQDISLAVQQFGLNCVGAP